MIQLVIVVGGAIGLILFVAFVIARLVRSRRLGLSIRMQTFLALAAIVGSFALGLGFLVLDRIQARATLLAQEAARSEAAAVSAIVANEVEQKGRSVGDVGRDLRSAKQPMHVTLLDADGHTVFEGTAPSEGASTVQVDVAILAGGAEVGIVRVRKPTIVIQRLLADFAPTILLLSVILGITAGLAATIIGRAIAAPIEAMTDFAVRVSEGERRAVPPPALGREVRRLSHAIDSMRRELEGRPFVETFAADLSHELKNPVAAIRASAETLADGALDEPEEATRFVQRIREATSRIEALLGDLLSLARIEARGVEDALAVKLFDVANEIATAAREDGASIEVRGAGATARGDRLWIGRAVQNLVDNARVHGTGGAIQIEIDERSGDACILVKSRGRVSDHVKKRLFRRFVTTRPDRGGTGLGLAIVRAVAEAHGGAVDCLESGPPEVVFRLKLPVA